MIAACLFLFLLVLTYVAGVAGFVMIFRLPVPEQQRWTLAALFAVPWVMWCICEQVAQNLKRSQRP